MSTNLPNPPALTPSALVRVVYDTTLTDLDGTPIEATISHEDDGGEATMVITFGTGPLYPSSALVLAQQLRTHAGAPNAQADGGDCAACGESRCGACTRPGGSRLAADDQLYPTCCCGRRFRS